MRKNHAPWCTYAHEGPCPAENEPAPDHPVWAERDEARAALADALCALQEAAGWDSRSAREHGGIGLREFCEREAKRLAEHGRGDG